MRKIWLVAKREYLIRVRSRAFIIGTIGLPVTLIGVLIFAVVMSTRQTDHTLRIAVLDLAGGLAKPIAAGMQDTLPSGKPVFQVVRTIESPGVEASGREQLTSEVRRENLDGYLVIPKEVLDGKDVEFHTRNPGDIMLLKSVVRPVNDVVISRRLSQRGIHIPDLSNLVRGVGITLVKVTRTGEAEEQGQAFLVPFITVMVLYMTLVIYGVATMRSVLEEKTARIVEILASSIRPVYLMAGKILGVAGVGMTQYLIWGTCGALISGYGAVMVSAMRPGASLPHINLPLSLLGYTAVFFLVGYLLYASMYAAVGAMVSSDEDAQQVQLPVTLMIAAAPILYPVMMRDPSSKVAIILSMIPFLSPILMVFRIALQTPPLWQIALSLGILLVTTTVIVQVAAKIYRVGILMYGKPPSVVELLRWLRYT